jgi:hypothetical protein
MREILERVGDGVIADAEFIRPRTDASHLSVDAGNTRCWTAT